MTFLDLALTFAVVAVVLVFVSHWGLGAQLATGVLGSAILVILLENVGQVQAIEQATLGRLGAAGKQLAPAGSGSPSNGTVAG